MSAKSLSLFSLGITGLMAASCSHETVKPNVIIILADDMGYGDVSFNNPQARTRTPNIDNMARNGICFSDAHSGGAVSIPSRYGILTGRYYFRLPEQRAYWGYLPPLIEEGRETIGSVMKRAGYTTACIGKWHLGLNWQFRDSASRVKTDLKRPGYTNTDFTRDISGGPQSLGFDYSFIIPASLDMPPYVFVRNSGVVDKEIVLVTDHYSKSMVNTEYVWDRKHTGDNDIYWGRGVWWRNGEMSRSFKVEECLDVIVNEGVTFMNEQVKNNPQKPFMLYLALTAPHTPWIPGVKFCGSSAMGTYGDFISMVDDVVGQITGTLKALNIYDNTLLIFTSDNGAHWSENDIQAYGHQSNWKSRGQKGDIWEGGHHVPMFVVWPSKISKAFNYSHTISLVDIMATLAEMTGVKIKENSGEDSFSFYEVIDGNHGKPVRESIIYISSANKLAIEKNSWKFIDCLGSGGFTDPSNVKPVKGGPQGQLYNLESDPLETKNLYLNKSLIVNQLSGLLDSLVRQGYSRKATK